jgi:hypothetical protein
MLQAALAEARGGPGAAAFVAGPVTGPREVPVYPGIREGFCELALLVLSDA